MRTVNLLAAVAFLAGRALAQSDVDTADKWAWHENIGWTNWYDAGVPSGVSGVQVHETYLSGFIWAENVGWISLGDGDPGAAGGSESAYANANGLDFGVNMGGGGGLSGYGWGENIGWVNFSGGALATPPNPARLDADFCRLRGYAWGENTGWLNLDHATAFVGIAGGPCGSSCLEDCSGDGLRDQSDLAQLLSCYGIGACCDINDDGITNQADLAALLAVYGQPCP